MNCFIESPLRVAQESLDKIINYIDSESEYTSLAMLELSLAIKKLISKKNTRQNFSKEFEDKFELFCQRGSCVSYEVRRIVNSELNENFGEFCTNYFLLYQSIVFVKKTQRKLIKEEGVEKEFSEIYRSFNTLNNYMMKRIFYK